MECARFQYILYIENPTKKNVRFSFFRIFRRTHKIVKMQIQGKNLFCTEKKCVMCVRVCNGEWKYIGQTVAIECGNAIANMLRSWRHDWIFPIKLNIYFVDECCKTTDFQSECIAFNAEMRQCASNDASEWMRLLTIVWSRFPFRSTSGGCSFSAFCSTFSLILVLD